MCYRKGLRTLKRKNYRSSNSDKSKSLILEDSLLSGSALEKDILINAIFTSRRGTGLLIFRFFFKEGDDIFKTILKSF